MNAAALWGAASTAAHASPPDDPFVGGIVFTGPAHPHPSAFYINPAALGLDRGHHLFAAGTLRLDRASVARAAIDPTTGAATNQTAGSVDANTLSPGWFVSAHTDFNQDRFSAGLAHYTTMAETYPDNDDELRYHASGGHQYHTLTTGALSIRVHDRLRFGMAVSIMSSSFQLGFSRDTALDGGSAGVAGDCGGSPCGVENPQAAESYYVDISNKFSFNLAFTGGVVAEVVPGWWVGLGVAFPPGSLGELDVELDGDARVELAPRDGGDVFDARSRVTLRLPWSLQLGGRGPLTERLDVVGGIRFARTSRHELLDIRLFGREVFDNDVPEWNPRYRGLDDTWSFDAGVEAPPRSRVRLGARARIDSAAVGTDSLSPLQLGGWTLSLAAGAELRPLDWLAVSAAYSLGWFPPRNADATGFDPEARLACVDQMYAFDECAKARDGRAQPTAAGDYTHLRHSFAVTLGVDWL